VVTIPTPKPAADEYGSLGSEPKMSSLSSTETTKAYPRFERALLRLKGPGTSQRVKFLQNKYARVWDSVLEELTQPWERYLTRSCTCDAQWRLHVRDLDKEVRAVLQSLYRTQTTLTHTMSAETMASVLAAILEADMPGEFHRQTG